MQLTIELSEKTVRKMRALAVLQESDNSDFMVLIENYIDQAVSEKIAIAVGFDPTNGHMFTSGRMFTNGHMFTKSEDRAPAKSGHEIAEGLSYEPIEDEEVAKPKAHATGLRLEDLDKMDDVGELGGSISPDEAELTFAEAFGLGEEQMDAHPSSAEDNPFREPAPNPVTQIPRSTPARKLPKNVKAKVSAYEGSEEASF